MVLVVARRCKTEEQNWGEDERRRKESDYREKMAGERESQEQS